jgi:beta-galactosidase/beta-glucuronidase
MKKISTIIIALATSVMMFAGNGNWAPAGDKIKTPWAEQVSPNNVHPEYPRPQMVRSEWKSLNGLWDYAVVEKSAPQPAQADGQILVPFCIESALSGVAKRVTDNDALWYTTKFNVPKTWKGKRVKLNFDAVDWQAEVFVNDVLVGTHTGGYTSFSFDITPYLAAGTQKLVVKVTDNTHGEFTPCGKQVENPSGIWYTPVTGIWQTVWLEPVAAASITDYYAVSDIDKAKIDLDVMLAGAQEGDVVEATLVDGGVGYSTEEKSSAPAIATIKAAAGAKISFAVPSMQTWSPENPYLYGLNLKLIRAGKVIDEVKAYTAMRKSSTVKDANGIKRIGLNNKPHFQYGPLDQGWWPDGLYTAPTDEALKFDVVKTRDFGYNMIRKHIKVEPSRWYYHCDREGVVVWQDMPSIAHNVSGNWGQWGYGQGFDFPVTKWAKENYYKEWAEIINQFKKFQCIVVWVPFNEAWGQFDTEKVVEFTDNLDNTRLINSASGGNHHMCGDIHDSHNYPRPRMKCTSGGQLIDVLGEYGGIGYPVMGHLWQADKNWGYVKYDSSEAVLKEYIDFAEELITTIPGGCSAAVYTQTTDVEGEVNGIMTYDRKVIKVDEAKLKEINQKVIKSLK